WKRDRQAPAIQREQLAEFERPMTITSGTSERLKAIVADIAPAAYPDLHAHVAELSRSDLLIVVDEPVNKDTEMHPLVRWQSRRGTPESGREAFLFPHPPAGKGRRYDCAVLVAGLAATPAVYRVGFGKPLEQIGESWINAIANPIQPTVIERGPCQERVT